MERKELSTIRREVGAKGLATRWGGRFAKATACIRVYPTDAEKIKREATALKRLPADVVADLLRSVRA